MTPYRIQYQHDGALGKPSTIDVVPGKGYSVTLTFSDATDFHRFMDTRMYGWPMFQLQKFDVILPECRLEWKDNFYSDEVMRGYNYGFYSPDCYQKTTRDGIEGRLVREGVCPIHGVVISMLGGMPNMGVERHPCGAEKK